MGVVDITALALLVPRDFPQKKACDGGKVARDGRELAENVLAPGDEAVELVKTGDGGELRGNEGVMTSFICVKDGKTEREYMMHADGHAVLRECDISDLV